MLPPGRVRRGSPIRPFAEVRCTTPTSMPGRQSPRAVPNRCAAVTAGWAAQAICLRRTAASRSICISPAMTPHPPRSGRTRHGLNRRNEAATPRGPAPGPQGAVRSAGR